MPTSPDHHAASPETFSLDEAMRRERRAIWGRFGTDAGTWPTQGALCLSGGGIRSAAFCLGVLQGLARAGLLHRFHYLSTVSGGGYVGAWLQAWLLDHARRCGRDRVTAPDLAAVERALGAETAAPEVQRLRGFTSFLTPKPGLSSPDTWAGVVLWLRNVMINWAVFGPAMFALALLPLIFRDALAAMPDRASPAMLLLAMLPAGVSAVFACTRLPSHTTGQARDYSNVAAIVRYSALPALLWSALLPLAVAPFLLSPAARHAPLLKLGAWGPAHLVPLALLAVLMLAYAGSWAWCGRTRRPTHLYRANLGPWIAGCVVACGVLGLAIRLAAMRPASAGSAASLAIAGPAAVMLSHLGLTIAFVALRREVLRGDLDREWLARLSAIKLVPVLLWSAFAAASLLLLPTVLATNWTATWAAGSAAVTAAAGLAGALLGKSSKSAGGGTQGIVSVDTVAALLTLVFADGLLASLSWAGDALLHRALPASGPGGTAATGAVLAAACLVLGWALGQHVNVNRFSLHGVYRNRLVRAFLGSVRPPEGPMARQADPFTDFDPADNIRMQQLAPAPGETRRLFPVIGTAMNLVSGAPRGWAERKAAPFTITPVACGSTSLPDTQSSFADTAIYAGSEPQTGAAGEPMGMTLGTAMTISGAAVSPNMGYHSSAWTAFLMTLFDVRLGAWLPNPAVVRGPALRRSKPPNALRALADEMLGRTDSAGPAVYLSDGGHFDNLGLYEMIRRRCQMIVVVDAGQDPGFAFADLAGAVRKVRIDMNVEIKFTMPMPMGPEASWTGDSTPYALADITWRDPVLRGRLLYLKPCRLPSMPVDVRSYAAGDLAFPNDTTLDQFFTESRFESYRKLGVSIFEQAAGDPALSRFMAQLRTL